MRERYIYIIQYIYSTFFPSHVWCFSCVLPHERKPDSMSRRNCVDILFDQIITFYVKRMKKWNKAQSRTESWGMRMRVGVGSTRNNLLHIFAYFYFSKFPSGFDCLHSVRCTLRLRFFFFSLSSAIRIYLVSVVYRQVTNGKIRKNRIHLRLISSGLIF